VSDRDLGLDLLPAEYVVARLHEFPHQLPADGVLQVLRDGDEVTVVCESGATLPTAEREDGWRCLKVRGPLPVTAVGIIARIGEALATARVPVFVVSGWSTDYVLVPGAQLADALAGLEAGGMVIHREPGDR
jgi:hypothetical protein